MAACFAFLPHVRVPPGKQLQIGPFILWRNAPAEWISRFGADNTTFLEMYRDERGEPVGERATVLTKADLTEASYEEFRDAVYCLSTALWIRGPSASDAWVFERWNVDIPTPPDQAFRRAAKFSLNLTSANVDRVYPTPYTHRLDIQEGDQEVLHWLGPELAKARNDSMLTAFSHFHLGRFDTPYFTSPGDSVEAMWSGLESLLEIDKFGPVPLPRSNRRCERLRRCLREVLSSKKDDRERVGKDAKLLRALRAEFGKYEADWRPELWQAIEAWTKHFYLERNHHSHGAKSDAPAKTVEPYGLSAFEISVHLSRAALHLRWSGDNFLIAGEIAERLNSLFLFAPVVRRVVSTLRQHDRKTLYPGTAAQLGASEWIAFHRALEDLASLRSGSWQFRNDVQVAQARQKMGLVLSAWTTDLLKQRPPNINLAPVAQLPNTIKAGVAGQRSVEDIDNDVATMLAENAAGVPEAYGSDEEPRLLLGGHVPLWLWVASYIKLSEVWLGHPLT